MKVLSFSMSILTITALSVGCRTPDDLESNIRNEPILTFSGLNERFGDYWYQGAAEITSYDLEQARYGEIHPGTAVTIFVTEDLSRERQVKLDDPYGSPDDAVNVLKLNATRNFNTGVYPYSMMTSVFTPVHRDEDGATLKVTASVQEWCGQTFAQVNRTEGGYRIRHYSYFEQDGDGDERLDDVILEDELWNIVRLNPRDLPTGSLEVLPAASYQRLSHRDWDPARATAAVQPSEDDDELMEYRLEYADLGRTLLIRYRRDFPHEIQYWEESQAGRQRSDTLVTRATLKRRLMLDYWTRNRPTDVELRSQLGL